MAKKHQYKASAKRTRTAQSQKTRRKKRSSLKKLTGAIVGKDRFRYNRPRGK